jgi:hypothetical protein
MIQQLAHADMVFSGLSKLRPVERHWRIKIEQFLVDKAMRADGSKPFGGRKQIDERVASPGTASFTVSVTAPQVERLLAIDIQGDGGAVFIPLREILGKRCSYSLETRVTVSLDRNFGHASPIRLSRLVFLPWHGES